MKRLVCAVLALVLALCAGLWTTAGAWGQGSATTLTQDITDTENLLGGEVDKVTDAIDKTREESGVNVRLLYVDAFNSEDEETPEQWATQVLNSTEPKPNTVMLAVASSEGNLVVVVSGNSDGWLRSEKTVDALSEAAAGPLTDGDSQDWAGAALKMMEQVRELARTSTNPMATATGVAIMVGGLTVLVILAAVMVVVHRHKTKKTKKHVAHSGRGMGKMPDSASPSVETSADGLSAETEITDDIQETSSQASQAGEHE